MRGSQSYCPRPNIFFRRLPLSAMQGEKPARRLEPGAGRLWYDAGRRETYGPLVGPGREDTRMSAASFHRPRLPINCWLKVALCLALCLTYPAQAETADEAALRALTKQFFTAS